MYYGAIQIQRCFEEKLQNQDTIFKKIIFCRFGCHRSICSNRSSLFHIFKVLSFPQAQFRDNFQVLHESSEVSYHIHVSKVEWKLYIIVSLKRSHFEFGTVQTCKVHFNYFVHLKWKFISIHLQNEHFLQFFSNFNFINFPLKPFQFFQPRCSFEW